MGVPRQPLEVPVDGGQLRGSLWPADPGAPLVVAAHGITSNHLAWAKAAEALTPAAAVAAPDLRGRVRSAALPGPWGLHRHAADLLAVLDHLGAERAVLAGHSMGAWAVLLAAAEKPERVAGLVLVDGGVALPMPPDQTTDEVLAAVLGPSLERLALTFASRDAYLERWTQHPAFASGLDRLTREHLLADLVGSGFLWRSSVRADAVRTDGAELLVDEEVRGALDAVLDQGAVPITLLRAPRGLLDEPSPLVPEAAAAPYAERLEVITVEAANHFSILLGDAGAAAVAAALRAAVARGAPGTWKARA